LSNYCFIAPLSGKQAQRTQQNTFSCAGFACYSGEPIVEIELHRFQQGEVTNAQRLEHKPRGSKSRVDFKRRFSDTADRAPIGEGAAAN
jgi:hypothetical protein